MTDVIDTKGKKVEKIVDSTNAKLREGKVVVLRIQGNANPDRIIKIMHAVIGDYDVELTVRHVELREFLVHASSGAAIGAGVGAISVLSAIAMGNPVTWPVALAAIGVGALLGVTIGSGAAFISSATVYKYQGETRIKFVPA